MQLLKKIIKSDYGVFLLFIALVSFVYLEDLINVLTYLNDNSLVELRYINSYDSICQHIPYHKEFFRLLDAGTPFAWDWNLFLGSNFYVTKAYYLVGDVFTYITYVLNFFIQSLEETMFFVMLLKIAFSGFTFYLLLKKVAVNKTVAIVFGILYAVSGWQSTFLEHTMYTSFYACMPLFFLGLETILQDKKYILFMISSFVLVTINYYLLWPVCLFALGYWCLRYILVEGTMLEMKFLKLSLTTLLSFLLMMGLSALLWLPSLLHMLSSTRVGNSLVSYSQWPFETVAAVLTNLLSPSFRDYAPIFDQGWYYFNQLGLYIGVLPLVLLPSLMVCFKDKRKTLIYVICLIVACLILIHPKIGYIFHFTYSLRYIFITSFVMLFVSAQVLTNTKKFNLLYLWSGVVFVLLIWALIYFNWAPAYYGEQFLEFKEIEVLTMSAMLAIMYGIILSCWGRFKLNTKIVKVALVAVFVFEILNISAVSLRSTKIPEPQYTFLYGDMLSEYEQVVENISVYDESFYRTYSTIGELNEQLYVGHIKTLSTYDSVYQYQLRDFLYLLHLYPDVNWIYDIDHPYYFQELGVKYLVCYNEEAYIYEKYIGAKNEELSSKHIAVYELIDEPFMAKSYNELIDIREPLIVAQMELNPTSEVLKMIDKQLAVDQSIIQDNVFEGYIHQSNYEEVVGVPTSYNDNEMFFNLSLPQNSVMYFAIPYDAGWSAFSNGKEYTTYSVNGGFVGILLEAGNHEIVLKYQIYGFNTALLASLTSLCLTMLWIIYLNKRTIVAYYKKLKGGNL